ncbi:MAG: response regulator transcription factor [Roseburia sp.]|nr:response regulator transcription factor [Roseburia sp.]MCM1202047.1 response regulator transcription factor [Bacteroides fragilis]
MDKILIVEDNMELLDSLCRNLQEEGFTVYTASSLAQARKYLDSGASLCLLDLNLPDGDGFSFCEYLSTNTAIPIILLTVRDGAEDMVKGLSIGADDYVAKPFHVDVLVSRIRAVLRRVRSRKADDDNLYCGDICINKKASKVYKKDCPLELTPNEYQLLCLLLEHKNQTITREQILEKLWDVDGNYVNDNTLTTLVKRLRQKVEDHPQMPKMLLTVRGFGYKAVDYEG